VKFITENIKAEFPNAQIKIVTNGTILNSDIMEFIKQHNVTIMISLDGPKRIHDRLRRFRDGRGSYDVIIRNISKLQKEKIPFEIATTLTSVCPYLSEIYQHLKQLQPTLIDFTPVEDRSNSPLIVRMTDDVIDDWAKTEIIAFKTFIAEGHSVTSSILRLFLLLNDNKVSEYECGLGVTKFAVACNGEVYPCIGLLGHKNFYMGSIWEEDFPDNTFFAQYRRFMKIFNINYDKECRTCWRRYLCMRCYAFEIIYGRKKCSVPESYTEKLLQFLAEILLVE